MNSFSLEGKHIMITGSSSGIGKQCAISCSNHGARLTLIARNNLRLRETINSLKGEGHRYIEQDITELSLIEKLVKEAVQMSGKIDGFIHAAGIETTLPIKMHKPNIFQDLYAVNTFAPFEFIRIISQNKYFSTVSCSIVLISSVMGTSGNSGLLGYSSSKGALIAGVKSLAIELSKKNIRVNTVSPGHIKDTAMSLQKEETLPETAIKQIEYSHPLGLGEVEDVANACVFLLSNAGKWITGTNLIVDGGYSAK